MAAIFSAKWKRDRARDYTRRRRARIVEYLGGACSNCGRAKNLQVDHIDPATKSFEPMMCGFAWDRLVEELKKCQLLCVRCHKAKTYRERWPEAYQEAARRAREGKAAKRAAAEATA